MKRRIEMKQYLLPEYGNFYKANLHCHTNLSDGALSPEEVKKIYKEKGYSVIAYTDHDILIPHPELADEKFLPLNAFEMEINEPAEKDFSQIKCCHLCFIALEPDNVVQPCWHRTKYRFGNADQYKHLVKFDETEPDYEREYTADGINDLICRCREKGFFVTYNHPTWSQENYREYSSYTGMHAMEICNFGCMTEGYEDYNPRVYDDMLRAGKRIYCIAADDNHNRGKYGTRKFDSFGGFTMIKADRLDYRTITGALEAGNFYASQGPEIHALWMKNGKLYIECGPAEKIQFTSGIRRNSVVWAEPGESVTEAVFDVKPEDVYIRVTVTDHAGRHADTRAYFTDELFSAD